MKWKTVSFEIFLCLAIVGIAFGADEVAVNSTLAANNTPAINISPKDINYIFIQGGSSGSFVKDESGNYTLTIKGVAPHTVGVADRPDRDAGFIKMADFLAGFSFDPQNPPNAAISLRDADDNEDLIVVELTEPKYDEADQTLTYKAKVTHDFAFESSWGDGLAQEVDAGIPESFGNVTLIIDDCPCKKWSGCPHDLHDTCYVWYEAKCDWCANCC